MAATNCPSEVVVRGDDLIAIYEQTRQRPFRVTIYWRATGTTGNVAGCSALSVIVSIETSRLESRPTIEIVTRLAADEIVDNADAPDDFILRRLPGSELSYAEMAGPGDARGLVVDPSDGTTRASRWLLFGQFLEKGVIRQARLQGVVLPRHDDVGAAATCCRAFRASAIPLTV